MVAAGPPREILTADLVRDVFGLDCVVVPCPVTGAPLVVPALTTPTADAAGRRRRTMIELPARTLSKGI